MLPADKCQIFPQIDTIILGMWPGMPKLPKTTSLLFLCNILRKKWVMKLIFLHANKYESLLQIDTITFIGLVKHSKSSSQNSKVTMSVQYLKKEIREFIFSLQMNIKVSYKLISTLWVSKMPTRRYYHYCCLWSSILKVLKVISLQYLYNISKKEVKKGVYFLHADEH